MPLPEKLKIERVRFEGFNGLAPEPWLLSILKTNLTFALKGHFRRSGRRILFAFNGGAAERAQVKTLPLF